MVLRRTSGPKKGELTGGWRRLNNEELRNSYDREQWRALVNTVTYLQVSKQAKDYQLVKGDPE
jgi:hypothetical protein